MGQPTRVGECVPHCSQIENASSISPWERGPDCTCSSRAIACETATGALSNLPPTRLAEQRLDCPSKSLWCSERIVRQVPERRQEARAIAVWRPCCWVRTPRLRRLTRFPRDPRPSIDAKSARTTVSLPPRIDDATLSLHRPAGVAHLVERQLPKLNVEGSNPFARSIQCARLSRARQRHAVRCNGTASASTKASEGMDGLLPVPR